jgi:ABC-type uncharacterized transport system substrate-binding protein
MKHDPDYSDQTISGMKKLAYSIYSCFLALIFVSCVNEQKVSPKILYINSYHQGYGSSDDIFSGIRQTLQGEGVELSVFYMDAKRQPEETSMAAKVDEVLALADSIKPELIIASDDHAVKHVIEPHLKSSSVPVVFCGVNWTAEPYGLPSDNVTGMLEILPLRATIDTMRNYYPQMEKMFVLSENTLSEKKNQAILDTLCASAGLRADYRLVDTFGEWQQVFEQANRQADIIFIPTNGGIRNWDTPMAVAFVREHIRVPVITCDDFMMAYSVFGLTKIAREQGVWAAEKALAILEGKDPGKIPLSRNRQTKAYINPALADKIGWQPSERLLNNSKNYSSQKY